MMRSVTVIVPCFNAGAYLKDCVASALAQGSKTISVDVIVVDDGSSDTATADVLRQVGVVPGVSVISNPGPRGAGAARNEGVRRAKGDWIAFLDADDWWPDDSLASRFTGLDAFPDAEWIGGDFVELRRDGKLEESGRFERNLSTYTSLTPAYTKETKPIRLSRPFREFFHQTPTHTIVTLLKKSLFNEIGGFDERFIRQQDYHLFLRLSHNTPFIYVPKITAYYRLHESNSTRSLTHTQEWRIKVLKDLRKTKEFSDYRSDLKSRISSLHLSNSLCFREEGSFLRAASSALLSIGHSPSRHEAWRSLVASLFGRR